MQKYPIGIQTLSEIINGGYLYIDKTEYIYKLFDGKFYFLSRPRRFGKSLLVSTLKEIFNGNRELFKGLWIYDKISWDKYPVIHIDFSQLSYKSEDIVLLINKRLAEIGNEYNIQLTETHHGLRLKELIEKLSATNKVAILIDEYDKPIIDNLEKENIHKAHQNRELLKQFYSILKGSDQYIHFLFLTGVSKFSKVSIFSDLNNLLDLTTHPAYACMLGYTQTELEHYFATEIAQYSATTPNFVEKVKTWYNGFSWDAKNTVYNPFSMLIFMQTGHFGNYWYNTGTPTFLLKLLKEKEKGSFSFNSMTIPELVLDKNEIDNLEPMSLMFQTGYLTLKAIDQENSTVTLGYPNREVENAFTLMLLAEVNNRASDSTGILVYRLSQCLAEGQVNDFIFELTDLFTGLDYINTPRRESYYHSIFLMVVRLLGYLAQSEVITSTGRIDCVIWAGNYIYIVEFKVGNAADAMAQIKAKNYAAKYANQNKEIVLLGIGFNAQTKNVNDYLTENAV